MPQKQGTDNCNIYLEAPLPYTAAQGPFPSRAPSFIGRKRVEASTLAYNHAISHYINNSRAKNSLENKQAVLSTLNKCSTRFAKKESYKVDISLIMGGADGGSSGV